MAIKSKGKIIIVIILLLIECMTIFLMWNTVLKNRPEKEEVRDILDKDKMFAIMLGDNGVYKESSSNEWPDSIMYIYNEERSGCLDMDGKIVENSLTFNVETKKAKVTATKGVSCYLYFDLEKIPPKDFTFTLNGYPNPEYTNKTVVSANLSWQEDDVREYCVTAASDYNNCVWQSVSGNSMSLEVTLPSGDGTKTISAYLKDAAGNISDKVIDTIIVDTVAPTNNSVSINNNATYTTSTSVTLTLSSTGASEMCISNTNTCTNWESYKTSKTHILTTGDATKRVYVWFRDLAGNVTSTYVYDDIILDTVAPTNNSVSINNNATYTTGTSVTLTLASTGASTMCISNTNSCTNYVTYQTSVNHTLTTGDGNKTVYVWFKDEAGNTTSYVTDTITLDTVAPTNNSVSINNNATYTTSTSVTLTLSSTGASTMCISNTTTCTNYVTYNTSYAWTLSSGDGTKNVYVWFKDAAGNTTTYVTDTIILDTVNPSVTNAIDAGGGKVSFRASDATSGVLEYCVNKNATSTAGCTWYNAVSGTNTSGAIVTINGTYYVHLKDKASRLGHSSAISMQVYSCPDGGTLTNDSTYGYICVASASSSYTPPSSSSTYYEHNCYQCGCEISWSQYCYNGWEACGFCDEWGYESCMAGPWTCHKCGSCTKTTTTPGGYTYYCPTGWNTYSGSGETLKCYKQAS